MIYICMCVIIDNNLEQIACRHSIMWRNFCLLTSHCWLVGLRSMSLFLFLLLLLLAVRDSRFLCLTIRQATNKSTEKHQTQLHKIFYIWIYIYIIYIPEYNIVIHISYAAGVYWSSVSFDMRVRMCICVDFCVFVYMYEQLALCCCCCYFYYY